MSSKVLLYLFVESENIGKAINALSEGGITGFFLNDYKGMSPQDWKGFLLAEDPEMALKIINEISKNTVMIGTVVSVEKLDGIREIIYNRLSEDRYTLICLPVVGLEVNRPD